MKLKLLSSGIMLFLFTATIQADSNNQKTFGTCTNQIDAFNMMTASQVYSGKLSVDVMNKRRAYEKASRDYSNMKLKDSKVLAHVNELVKELNIASKKWIGYVSETGELGRVIHEGKFQNACDKYIEISHQYGGHIEKDYKISMKVDKPMRSDSASWKHCSSPQASVVLMVFMQELKNNQIYKPEIQKMLDTAALKILTEPNEVCKSIKVAAKKSDVSYQRIIHTAQGIIAKNAIKREKHAQIVNKNAASNSECTEHDMITLSYKIEDFRKKFLKLSRAWKQREIEAGYAKLKNSKLEKLLLAKHEHVMQKLDDLNHEYDKKVDSDGREIGKYDLACQNYKALEIKYNNILANEQKDYDQFDAQEALKNYKVTSKNQNQQSDFSDKEQYNNIVEIINKVTPQMYAAFDSYARECGRDKNKRVHARVEEAVAMAGGHNREIYEKAYGYHITRKFNDRAMESIAKLCDVILEHKDYADANKIVLHYKETTSKYMRLINEAAEYYNMKDYEDDNFKKADQIHKPIVEAFEEIGAMDRSLRDILNKIADKQTLAKIEFYKNSNQKMFYHVAKAQYLSKKLYDFASHKKEYMQLDPKKLRVEIDKLKAFYTEFKTYERENKTVFDDNGEYRTYLNMVHDYLQVSEEFYLRVKNKDDDDAEDEFLQNIPKFARDAMQASLDGTLSKLLKHYNALVHKYNSLDM